MIDHTLPPNGDRGKRPLTIQHSDSDIFVPVETDGRCTSSVGVDWYNDHLQFIVMDGQIDEVAVYIRMNKDGSVAEIVVRDDLMSKVGRETGPDISQWQKERDGE